MEENMHLVDSAVGNNGVSQYEEGGRGLVGMCNLQHCSCHSVILVLFCLSTFSYYYCADMQAALEHTIIQVMKVDTSHYELLYSLSYWPSVIIVPAMGACPAGQRTWSASGLSHLPHHDVSWTATVCSWWVCGPVLADGGGMCHNIYMDLQCRVHCSVWTCLQQIYTNSTNWALPLGLSIVLCA